MVEWEYMTTQLIADRDDNKDVDTLIVRKANELGCSGWELIEINRKREGRFTFGDIILKRPKR